MSMYFLPPFGWLHPQVHGVIPAEAVEVDDDTYRRLMDDQARGLTIEPGVDGRPVSVEVAVPVEGAARRIRLHRDRLLAASDWVVTKAMETGTPVPEAWSAYRQALRDIPDHSEFPLGIIGWPTPPQ